MWPCLRKPKTRNSQQPKVDASFVRNGGQVLEELISLCDAKSNPFQIFSAHELRQATNNYDQQGIFCDQYNYILYKGILPKDQRPVMIKKYGEEDEIYTKQAINEIAIASQINSHSKVLCLLGCCLETRVPILVFEFPQYGTLSHHIYRSTTALSWEKRLRIVMETADAVAYLHLAYRKPIIHRDISSHVIFLDESLGAKLGDFGMSVPIPTGETHVDAEVVGSFGFAAPESVETGRYTEKSDVFGFGAVLFEILTGNKARDIPTGIATAFLAEEPLASIELVTELYLNTNISDVGHKEQLKACSQLTLTCVEENPDLRPTMKEVARELRRIAVLRVI